MASTVVAVPLLNEIVRAHTDLGPEDVTWFDRLLADWQIISTLR